MGIQQLLHFLPQAILAVGLLVSAWYYCMAYVGARLFFRRPRGEPIAADLPGITVLKPLKGLDADLFENLSTFCRQDYPKFQIVFGVADADDPAIAVVRRLQAQYPHIQIDLVVDGRIYGTNYKISNLHNMDKVSRYDIVVIADSDIRVGPQYLQRIAQELADPKVGVVTCIYRAVSTGGLPTLLESLFINVDFGPSILVARLVEKTSYAFGATMALRRNVLNEIGGFLSVSNCLADDFFIGNRAVAKGYRVAISSMVVETVLAVGSWRRLLDHQVRWARTYRSVRRGGYFGLVLTYGTLWAVLSLIWNGFSLSACGVAGGLIALRLISANVIANRYLKASLGLSETFAILLKDALGTAVWLLAFLGDTVHWSGHAFRVRSDGTMERLQPGRTASVQTAYEPTAKNPDESTASA
ncbi:MAG: bacteriohopanetetrol glucosamine biosynthesis glycosyltransferase HpnI [Deltaproteobacteria bacterium]|nr:bacteriohopanetetrol glucosamine biosynthesis glycosyltransferase HpnI [Deltaproteobacteria bacterium]